MFDMMLFAKIATIVIAVGLGIGSYYYLGMKQDNPIEEAAEMIIKEQTGIDADLSPNSKEIEKPKAL